MPRRSRRWKLFSNMEWLPTPRILKTSFIAHVSFCIVLLLSRIDLSNGYGYTTLGASPNSKLHSGSIEGDGCRGKGEQAGYRTFERMGIVNWNGSYPVRALAFFTSTKCAPSGVSTLARLYDDPYASQYIDLSGAYIPDNLRSFRAIDLARVDDYGIAVLGQLKKMRPGTIYVPQVPGNPTKSSYRYGSIVIPPWNDQYDLSSGKDESWAEYKRAIVDLQTAFHDLRKDPVAANRLLGIDATEVPWQPGQEDLVTTSDIHPMIVRPRMQSCELLPASGEFGDYELPIEKRLKTQTFVEPGAVWDSPVSEPRVLTQEDKEELERMVARYSGGSKTSLEVLHEREQARAKARGAQRVQPQKEKKTQPKHLPIPFPVPRKIPQPELPQSKQPWEDFSVLTNPILAPYLQRGAMDALFDVASQQIVQNARFNFGPQQPTLSQTGVNGPIVIDDYTLSQENEFVYNEPVIEHEQPVAEQPVLLDDLTSLEEFLSLGSEADEGQEGIGQLGELQVLDQPTENAIQEAETVAPFDLMSEEVLQPLDVPFWLVDDFPQGEEDPSDEFGRYINENWARNGGESPGNA
ncbi:hypothetical protein Dda_8178 [Drechslerella dactyloides]|uniref:Uncharacterized protein n=1 Tax=Drechslerella dactyloides TaxID=74499 RepID=A0AAD6NGE9_DREDA|nr:hypothetical protein Dda_8178 [Drechslerella dactyloides]